MARWHHIVTYIWVNIGSGNGLLSGSPLLAWIDFNHSMYKSSHPLETDKVWDVITYPFRNFNSGTDDVLEWISNFTHKVCDVITYPLQTFNSGTVDVLE